MGAPHPGGHTSPEPDPGSDAASEAVHAVDDKDHGYFTVRTVTASYLLDLHARRPLRCPTYPLPDEPHARPSSPRSYGNSTLTSPSCPW